MSSVALLLTAYKLSCTLPYDFLRLALKSRWGAVARWGALAVLYGACIMSSRILLVGYLPKRRLHVAKCIFIVDVAADLAPNVLSTGGRGGGGGGGGCPTGPVNMFMAVTQGTNAVTPTIREYQQNVHAQSKVPLKLYTYIETWDKDTFLMPS